MSALEIRSEIAHDLLRDHLPTIVQLLDGPLSRDELVLRLGSPAALERMVRHGLVRPAGDRFEAVAGAYHQVRQEGMMTFLSHYVLPALIPGVDGSGLATLQSRRIVVPERDISALRGRDVARLFDDLAAISDRRAGGPTAQFSVLVIGSPQDDGDGLPESERALRHLREASALRASEATKGRAVLSQLYFVADAERRAAALTAIDRFFADLEEPASSSKPANYSLTVASHWQGGDPADDTAVRQ
jgi:hypothetical protein